MLCTAPTFSHYACTKGGAVLRYSYCAIPCIRPPPLNFCLSITLGGGGGSDGTLRYTYVQICALCVQNLIDLDDEHVHTVSFPTVPRLPSHFQQECNNPPSASQIIPPTSCISPPPSHIEQGASKTPLPAMPQPQTTPDPANKVFKVCNIYIVYYPYSCMHTTVYVVAWFPCELFSTGVILPYFNSLYPIVLNGISALFYDKTYFWHARRTGIAQRLQ